jgi:glucose/mannose-6-phosphate isomerase
LGENGTVPRLDLEEVREVDQGGLWEAYLKWPESSRRALSQPLELPIKHDTQLVVLAGMGGSGSACSLIRDWLWPIFGLPVIVVKDFRLPKCVNRHSLVIVVSYSGDTKEALSLLAEAVERKCSMITVSAGGLLEKRSKELGVPHNRVERLVVPRASVPGMLFVPLRILSELGLVNGFEKEAEESIVAIEKTLAEVSPSVKFARNPAKKTAMSLNRFRPVVYSSTQHASAAYHFKDSMNENAKVAVQVELLPELFHNEIETWAEKTDRMLVLLRHTREQEEIKKRIQRMTALVQARGTKVAEVWCQEGLLASLMRWTVFLDMVSIYVAVLRRTNPLSTLLLKEMKSV